MLIGKTVGARTIHTGDINITNTFSIRWTWVYMQDGMYDLQLFSPSEVFSDFVRIRTQGLPRWLGPLFLTHFFDTNTLGCKLPTMRSLPPPRVTRSRRWKRIKRAVAYFFTRGYVADPGAFLPARPRLVLIIKPSRVLPGMKRVEEPGKIGNVAKVGRIATKTLPLILPSSKLNLKLRVTDYW